MTSTPGCVKANVTFADGNTVPQVNGAKPPRRFVPELIETITKTNRRPPPPPIDTSSTPSSQSALDSQETPTDSSPNGSTKSTKRRRSRDKFAEEWGQWENKAAEEFGRRKHCETAKGTGKPRSQPSSPQSRRFRRGSDDKVSPSPLETTPTLDTRGHSPLFLEIERATSPLTRRRPSWASLRSHHSFKVPELDPIESSESEPSSPFSPSLSLSATSTQSQVYTNGVTQVAGSENVDERYSDYLLGLAADAADKQLREQALAAFPNDDHHEQIDHFIDREDTINVLTPAETPAEERNARRESFFPESNWGLLDMKQHREKLEKEKEAKKEEKKRLQARLNGGGNAQPKNDPWGWGDGRPFEFNPYAVNNLFGGLEDEELAPMRKSARPPLLGQDIEFPRCLSPEPVRMDCTQGCDAVQKAQEYLTEQSLAAEKGEGLWCGSNTPSARPSLYCLPDSGANSRSASPFRVGGLWRGGCTSASRSPPPGPTGLFTPRTHLATPPSPAPSPAKTVLPPTPPESDPDFACLDQKLAAEAAIEEEFSDSFVTQVYNYLSLGYPAVGRMFDEELSKISNIPVSELRQDDHLPSARGYIRLGEDRSPADNITEETCMRWRALRTYVKVWARQHPTMNPVKETLGATVRRGSWAQ